MLKKSLIAATTAAIAVATLSTGAIAGHGGWGHRYHSAFPWELAAPSRTVVKVYVRAPKSRNCSYYADKYERTGKRVWLRKYETCVVRSN